MDDTAITASTCLSAIQLETFVDIGIFGQELSKTGIFGADVGAYISY